MTAEKDSRAAARMTVIIILIAIIFIATIIGVWVFVFQPRTVPLPGVPTTLPGGEFETGKEVGDAYFR